MNPKFSSYAKGSNVAPVSGRKNIKKICGHMFNPPVIILWEILCGLFKYSGSTFYPLILVFICDFPFPHFFYVLV